MSKPVKHPGKTEAQRRALDMIGCGNHSPWMPNKTRDVLLRDGLIVEITPMYIGSGWTRAEIKQYGMPIPVHMQWCEACGEEGDSEIGAEA